MAYEDSKTTGPTPKGSHFGTKHDHVLAGPHAFICTNEDVAQKKRPWLGPFLIGNWERHDDGPDGFFDVPSSLVDGLGGRFRTDVCRPSRDPVVPSQVP